MTKNGFCTGEGSVTYEEGVSFCALSSRGWIQRVAIRSFRLNEVGCQHWGWCVTRNMSFVLCDTVTVHMLFHWQCKDFSPLCVCLALLQIQSNGDFITEQLKQKKALSSDYPASPWSMCIDYCARWSPSIRVFIWTIRCVSALAVHTLSITLTTGSTSEDNTNIQKRAQSLMGDWLFSHWYP